MEELSFPLKKSALDLESQNGAQMIRYIVIVMHYGVSLTGEP